MPSPAVAAVQAAVAALARCSADDVAPEQAMVDLAALLSVSQQLARVRVDRLADADRRSLHLLAGARSAAAWVARHGEVAAGELKVARRLAAFPAVGSALLDGTLTLAATQRLQAALGLVRPHLDAPDGLLDGADAEAAVSNVIVDGVRMAVAQARGGFPSADDPVLVLLLERLPAIAALPVPQLARLELALVLLAQHVEPAQLGGALELLTAALLPDRLEDSAEAARQRRWLALTRNPDGASWTLSGQLDLLTGERSAPGPVRCRPDRRRQRPGHRGRRSSSAARVSTPTTRTSRPRSARVPGGSSCTTHSALRDAATWPPTWPGRTTRTRSSWSSTSPSPTLLGQPGALPARTGTGGLLPRSLWAALPAGQPSPGSCSTCRAR